MTSNSPTSDPPLAETGASGCGELADALVDSLPCPSIYNSSRESQNKCGDATRQTRRMGGKPRKDGPTREFQRLHWLVVQLERDGVGQAELARRTGMTTSYVNAIRNPDRGRNSGMGAEIVRKMKDGMGLDPRYFYDDYEEQRDYKIYLLDAKREERRYEQLAQAQSALRADFAKLRAELLERDAKHAREVVSLEDELAAARRQSPPRRPAPSKRRDGDSGSD